MKPEEIDIVYLLREIADVYEQMGVDHLQREAMRRAATEIETLRAALKAATKEDA